MQDSRNQQGAERSAFDEFVDTIARLRGPGGCPWDREQTHASIARNMLEEAYEAVAAIEDDDVEHMREELGDVLLQVVLQAQIAKDAGEFDIDDVVRDIDAKMVRRHPHVFGVQQAFEAAGIDTDAIHDADDVLEMWDVIKAHERAIKEERLRRKRIEKGLSPDQPPGLLDDIPFQQPALAQAQEISRKAVGAGFEWETEEGVWDKVHEEIREFMAAERGSADEEGEFGDILFTLVNVARKRGIDAEGALRATCAKFRRRWGSMERYACEEGAKVADLPMQRKEELWQRAKQEETT
ncbi:MAG: nucleoside triphosphate pyrophosphohydrolase [Coriobacteriales bacterium]|jgi:tetrapyrrole methylase family protein/MazG family protein|nr:nucleoside triphosphate pyrophosphohydrolase [Coriobacteriales bacterium]